MTDLVPREERSLQTSQNIFDLGPKQMVAQASSMATVLADVIDKQKLYTNIQGKKHVRAEGWATLGSMLGILPKERSVVEQPDGSYEAFVDLVSVRDGRVIGGGSALCSSDESRWRNAERYARRSMAVTRATGKAYRLAFAWVMALAGYEGTPAEEMPNYGSDDDSGRASNSDSASKHSDSGNKRSNAKSDASPPKAASEPAAQAEPRKGPPIFDKGNTEHWERLGKVVGERLTDTLSQNRLIEYMHGKEMTKANVDAGIKSVQFSAVIDAEIL